MPRQEVVGVKARLVPAYVEGLGVSSRLQAAEFLAGKRRKIAEFETAVETSAFWLSTAGSWAALCACNSKARATSLGHTVPCAAGHLNQDC